MNQTIQKPRSITRILPEIVLCIGLVLVLGFGYYTNNEIAKQKKSITSKEKYTTPELADIKEKGIYSTDQYEITYSKEKDMYFVTMKESIDESAIKSQSLLMEEIKKNSVMSTIDDKQIIITDATDTNQISIDQQKPQIPITWEVLVPEKFSVKENERFYCDFFSIQYIPGDDLYFISIYAGSEYKLSDIELFITNQFDRFSDMKGLSADKIIFKDIRGMQEPEDVIE